MMVRKDGRTVSRPLQSRMPRWFWPLWLPPRRSTERRFHRTREVPAPPGVRPRAGQREPVDDSIHRAADHPAADHRAALRGDRISTAADSAAASLTTADDADSGVPATRPSDSQAKARQAKARQAKATDHGELGVDERGPCRFIRWGWSMSPAGRPGARSFVRDGSRVFLWLRLQSELELRQPPAACGSKLVTHPGTRTTPSLGRLFL